MSVGRVVLWILIALICGHLAHTYHLGTAHVLWFYAGLVVGLAVHEGGHALCALIVREPLRRVSIGEGPLLLRKRFDEMTFEWRLLPFAGIVQCYPDLSHRNRASQVLFILGGVLANAIVASIALGLETSGLMPPTAQPALTAMAIAQVWFIALNLFPRRISIDGIRIRSDGLELLHLLSQRNNDWAQRREFYAAQLRRYSSDGEMQVIEEPRSARIFYQLSRANVWAEEATRRDVQDALIREVDRGGLRPPEELLLLDLLLTYGLVSDDLKLRSKLDEWSLRALSLAPSLPTLLGTRGAILVALGRYQEGKILLSSLPIKHDDASFDTTFDTLLNQLFLALAEQALGDSKNAQVLAAAARATAKTLAIAPLDVFLTTRLEGVQELQVSA
jgi:hypothetical protein